MSISLLRSCLVCILAGVVVCATARFGASPASAEVPVDTLYYNGVIYTMTETPREAANADAPARWRPWPRAAGGYFSRERRKKPGREDTSGRRAVSST